MRIAQIINNIIHKIYTPEEAAWYPEGVLDLREVPDEAQEGWVWDGEAWAEPVIEPLVVMPSTEQLQAAQLNLQIKSMLKAAPDDIDIVLETVGAVASALAEPWQTDKVYAGGTIISYEDCYYIVNPPGHKSQADWLPSNEAALYSRIGDPGEEWPEWIEPTGAHNAYAVGAKVSYEGKYWINEYPANTYAPGVYGWVEVTE